MNFIDIIKKDLQEVVQHLYDIKLDTLDIHVERPGNKLWGDYASNISLTIANSLKQSPMKIAKDICYRFEEIEHTLVLNEIKYKVYEKIDFQAPGFINFTFSDYLLLSQDVLTIENLQNGDKYNSTGLFRGQNVLLEYTDPNPFKVFHIGHLMSNAIGESLSRIIEFKGAKVKRANYQGDVGMHISKSIWGALKKMKEERISLVDLEKKDLEKRMVFLGQAYSLGASEFEINDEAKDEMKEINAQVYLAAQEMLKEDENWTPIIDYSKYLPTVTKYPFDVIKEIYIKGRKWSLEEFENLYKKLGTNFDYYFFESKVGEYGYKIVQSGIQKGIFESNDGAIIFRGEKYGLHTRVFINSLGFPVYEAKDLGLAFLKYETYKYDKSYIITANEIDEYFKVVIKAMEQLDENLAAKTVHIGHGVMKFKEGKMSSRKGDVVTGKTMLEDAKQAILSQMHLSETPLSRESADEIAEKMSVTAVKYSILKHNAQKDIIYDQSSAIAVTGNTGPYLQYTHARTMSIIDKTDMPASETLVDLSYVYIKNHSLAEQELSLLRHLLHFDEVIERSATELTPGTICDYLFDLCQRFNSMYNDLSILNAENEGSKNLRLYITKIVENKLKLGLWLLGIEALDRV